MENGGSKDKSDHRVRGSEVFVGGLQRSVTEDMIREVFNKCGEIVEIRMMKDQNGDLKGYCFVRFTTREAALKAQKEKNGMILQGKKIGVAPSADQDTLFLGNLKKEWSQEELESMVKQAFQDVQAVELALTPSAEDSPADKKKQNRGFAFVQFSTHAAAARAHRVASRQDFMLGGKWHPIVDWAQTDAEPDPDEMAKVKNAFVSNLPSNVKEDFLRKLFEPFGKLERVAISRKRNTPVGFVHFMNRSDVEAAIKELDGKVLEGPDNGPKFKLQVTLAKPADKLTKRSREESQPTNVGAQGQAGGASGAYGSFSTAYGEYTDYMVSKQPRVASKPYGTTENWKDSQDRGGQQNKGSRSAASGATGRNVQAASRDSGMVGAGGGATSRLPVLDSFGIPPISSDANFAGYNGYSSLTSTGLHPNLAGGLTSEPLLPRMPTGLGDVLSSYRGTANSAAINLGAGLGTHESSSMDRRTFKFDPFTGEPFKFDPFTGEPIQPTSLPSTQPIGKYY